MSHFGVHIKLGSNWTVRYNDHGFHSFYSLKSTTHQNNRAVHIVSAQGRSWQWFFGLMLYSPFQTVSILNTEIFSVLRPSAISKCNNNNSLIKHLMLPFNIHIQLGSDETFLFFCRKILRLCCFGSQGPMSSLMTILTFFFFHKVLLLPRWKCITIPEQKQVSWPPLRKEI